MTPDSTAASDIWTRATWERAYYEAMRWRGWQTCELLIQEREGESWWLSEGATMPDDQAAQGESPMTAEDRTAATPRVSSRWAKLGFTLDDYERLLAAQGGGCAICGNPPKLGGRRLNVDHDHKTGAVRGLLCFTCNKFVTMKGVTAERCLGAACYLHAHAARKSWARRRNAHDGGYAMIHWPYLEPLP